MKTTSLVIIALLAIGLVFVAGCTTGQAYNPPSGPVGGGCGVGAPVDAAEDPCGDSEYGETVSL